MRRHLARFSLVFGALIVIGAGSVSFSGGGARPTDVPNGLSRATDTVLVTLQCGEKPDSVHPYEITVKRGDVIEWVLTPESDVERFMIKKKNFFGRWLFETAEIEGAPGRPAAGRDMKPNAEGRYRYNVIGICRGGPNEKIDPDVIVDPGT